MDTNELLPKRLEHIMSVLTVHAVNRDAVGMWRMRAWRDAGGEWHSGGEVEGGMEKMKDTRKMRKLSNNKFPFIPKPNSIWHIACVPVWV